MCTSSIWGLKKWQSTPYKHILSKKKKKILKIKPKKKHSKNSPSLSPLFPPSSPIGQKQILTLTLPRVHPKYWVRPSEH